VPPEPSVVESVAAASAPKPSQACLNPIDAASLLLVFGQPGTPTPPTDERSASSANGEDASTRMASPLPSYALSVPAAPFGASAGAPPSMHDIWRRVPPPNVAQAAPFLPNGLQHAAQPPPAATHHHLQPPAALPHPGWSAPQWSAQQWNGQAALHAYYGGGGAVSCAGLSAHFAPGALLAPGAGAAGQVPLPSHPPTMRAILRGNEGFLPSPFGAPATPAYATPNPTKAATHLSAAFRPVAPPAPVFARAIAPAAPVAPPTAPRTLVMAQPVAAAPAVAPPVAMTSLAGYGQF